MPQFAYTALGADGAAVQGSLSADSEVLALDLIARRGLVPVTLSAAAGAGVPWWQREIALTGAAGRLPLAEQERILTVLSALLTARLPLLRALVFCEGQAQGLRSRRALASLRSAVENGATLAAAMEQAAPAFPPSLIAVLASGEASNRLEQVMAQTARALAAEAAMTRAVKGALIYPAILLGMAVLVLAMIAFYLAPTLLPVFASAGVEAPLTLRIMAGAGRGLVNGWPVVLAGLTAVGVGGFALRRQLGAGLTALLMRLPLTGPHLRRRETWRLTQSLALMLESGAPLPRAVAMARGAGGPAAYGALMAQAESVIAAGGTLSATLDPSPLIDPMAMTLIRAGEEADRLAETLRTATDMLGVQVAEGIAQAIRLLTPVLTLLIGLGVGAVILATITAILDLNDLAI